MSKVMTAPIKYLFLTALLVVMSGLSVSAQNPDRRDVRKGNRDFRKEDYKAAEIDYRKALVKDSTSFAAGYNLGNTLYRMEDKEQAGKIYEKLSGTAPVSPYAADYYYNVGNVAADSENWQAAVDSYRQSLLKNPSDMDAKENYIYAKLKLKEQQDRNQDNQDGKDQDKQNQQNQDQNQNEDRKDNDRNDDRQDRNEDNRNDSRGQQNGQQPKITPQAAQQMLQAIQAKEKETQDKVNREKAQVLKSRQKEKNW